MQILPSPNFIVHATLMANSAASRLLRAWVRFSLGGGDLAAGILRDAELLSRQSQRARNALVVGRNGFGGLACYSRDGVLQVARQTLVQGGQGSCC